MSHLGDRLSALIDGELSHDERDRLHAHIAVCQDCRTEAAALRALKRRVGALGDSVMDARLLARLLVLAEPGEPVTARPRAFPGSGAPRPALHLYPDASVSGGRRRDGARSAAGRRRRAYVVAGAASFLVAGVAGLSFVVGGGQGAPSPRITPPVDMFTVEHSVTTGEVPFANPAATLVPAPAAPRGGP